MFEEKIIYPYNILIDTIIRSSHGKFPIVRSDFISEKKGRLQCLLNTFFALFHLSFKLQQNTIGTICNSNNDLCSTYMYVYKFIIIQEKVITKGFITFRL